MWVPEVWQAHSWVIEQDSRSVEPSVKLSRQRVGTLDTDCLIEKSLGQLTSNCSQVLSVIIQRYLAKI